MSKLTGDKTMDPRLPHSTESYLYTLLEDEDLYSVDVPFKYMNRGVDFGDDCTPYQPHTGDVGYDCISTIDATIHPGWWEAIPLGFACQMPEGVGLFLAARSSMAKRGLILGNSLGIVDPSYRGEVIAVFRNIGHEAQRILKGDRVAQVFAVPFFSINWQLTDTLTETERGAGGFGSTNPGSTSK
jgi:dUTP pyrophosphatase